MWKCCAAEEQARTGSGMERLAKRAAISAISNLSKTGASKTLKARTSQPQYVKAGKSVSQHTDRESA